MELRELNRPEYFESLQSITHFESLLFSKKAMDWWDSYFSWKKFPCLCLSHQGQHLSYLFYHIGNDNEYLTLHNILTPKPYRGKGHAFALLEALFIELESEPIRRLRLSCVSSSLPFYSRLGLEYWGVNVAGHYYSDLPMPENIESIPKLTKENTIENHTDGILSHIYEKVKDNGIGFDEKQQTIHQQCLIDLKGRYHFDALKETVKEKKLEKKLQLR